MTMQRRYDFGGSTTPTLASDGLCHDPAPEIQSCAAPAPCCPCDWCPPKVEKRNYVTIKPNTVKTCFQIGQDQCSSDVVDAATHCIELRIRRRGECPVVLTLNATSATLSGSACFEWALCWWQLRDGWYEADVYVNGESCLTIGLHQVGCQQALLGYSSTTGVPCGTMPSQCAAPIEDDYCAPYNPVGRCDDTCGTSSC